MEAVLHDEQQQEEDGQQQEQEHHGVQAAPGRQHSPGRGQEQEYTPKQERLVLLELEKRVRAGLGHRQGEQRQQQHQPPRQLR